MEAKVKGSDLRCAECGTGAKNVAPEYEFDESKTAISWTCFQGHQQMSGWRPSLSGLSEALDAKHTYQPALVDTAAISKHLDDLGRERFLEAVESRIDAMMRSGAAALEASMFNPANFIDFNYVPPTRWETFKHRASYWWIDAREWVAEKVLRVDIHQGRDDYE